MVELRKRKAPTEGVPPPVKKANSVKSTSGDTMSEATVKGPTPAKNVTLGDTVQLDGFGGEVETQEGLKVTLKKLVEDSKNGVVLFTYPKAATPGCTTQACLFRDEFTPLTATGLSIYGLSTDSPKSNSKFKTKQNLPYTLLCDPSASLIAAIGMKKAPNGTTRGVFVIDKDGKVGGVAAGGPAATVDVVRKLTQSEIHGDGKEKEDLAASEEVEQEIKERKINAQDAEQPEAANGDEARADVAAEVADSAQKLDSEAVA